MRIRKRAVPLPLSLLSPVRLLQLSDDSPPPANDLLIGRDRAAAFELKGHGNGKNKEKKEGNNHTSKESDTGAVTDNGGGVVPAAAPPTPSNKQSATEGRWCEGDKAIPFKKRKVSLELEMSKIGSSKMKSKTNKKCRLLDDDNSSDSDYDEKSKKKGKKGKTRRTLGGKYSWRKEGSGMLMEGSRCSRVNGRGWRCLQPTLVGYSLCEHHLGKGRLRSISGGGVRVEKLSTAPASSTPPRASEVKMVNCSDEEEEGSGMKKKKRKVGMVKARSLSSLLCQPETKVVVHHAPASNVVS